LSEEQHRKMMRHLADHFGIHGFCFYHYWFYDHPVMDKAVQRMIGKTDFEYPAYIKQSKDERQVQRTRNQQLRVQKEMKMYGEPNKPFFLCWANEGWSKRWDGSEQEVILAQNYDGEEQSKEHFLYLLDFFRHPNYIKIQNKPVFSIYRIEKHHVEAMDIIMEHWQQLAREHGFPDGIHFLRFLGPFDNSVQNKHIEGFIEFEPGTSSPI
jgi:hypothetical protein